MKLTYHRNGDYLLPDLAVNETDQQSLGKYGMLRLHFLQAHRPVLYNELLLSGKLVPHLHEIDMTCIQRLPLGHYTENGQDSIEFMISTNPGETVKPLGKVASGGELSRIMLAVKSVLADADAIETLIFDEIDTGISGRTAQKVSEKMAVIARKHQVICITHLPQIAAMADDHYVIEKSAMEQRTITEIYHLSDDASVGEIARLLGGVEITEAVMQNAREMKNLAQSKK